MSSVLFQEIDKRKKHVYFISKVFRGVESWYQKIEKLGLALVVSMRKLKPNFQSHKILVKTNYHVQ